MFCCILSQIFSKILKFKHHPFLEKKCLFVIATYAKVKSACCNDATNHILLDKENAIFPVIISCICSWKFRPYNPLPQMTPHPELLGSLAQDPDLKSKLTNFLHTKTEFENVTTLLTELVACDTDINKPELSAAMRSTPGQRLQHGFVYFTYFYV